MPIRLEPITTDNLKAVFEMKVAAGQEQFVASNAWSLAEALTEGDIAWPRAIAVDERVVGFLMLEIDMEEENGRPFWLWRLMINHTDQGRGHAKAALGLAIEELRRRGAGELYTSWVPGEGSPEGFYLKLGFVPNGELDDDEVVARLDLSPPP